MKELDTIPNEEEILRHKISVIEKIPTGVTPRSEVILILLGEQQALEMYIPNKDDAPKAVEDLRSVGLFAEISEKNRGRHPDSTEILVANSQEILEELKQIDSTRDHERYGQLMGYPQTAIDAFMGKDGSVRLEWDEVGKMLGVRHVLGGAFVFSKEHADEELVVVKRRSKLLAEKSPELFYDVYKKERANEILKYILENY